MSGYRKPTIGEAVDWILRQGNKDYRHRCIADWREKFGDKFADDITAKVKSKWKGSIGQKLEVKALKALKDV